MTDPHNLWTTAMREGRFGDAWALSDQALAARTGATPDDPALPYHRRFVWDGRPFEGADVLVRCYQGLGDTIMFARFLPALAARAASVTVEVQPALRDLIGQLAGVTRVIPFDPARPTKPMERDIEITELAHALRLSPLDAPAPYLRAERAPLTPGTIGLCHQGGDWDVARRISADLLHPLCERHPCLALVPHAVDLPVLNPGGCSPDIGETARLIAGLDLVVTVDTMVAHLAGALGRPAWLLLKAEPDWRWDPAKRDTPWYPSMRLYAQTRPGDWQSVIARVIDDLAAERAGAPGAR